MTVTQWLQSVLTYKWRLIMNDSLSDYLLCVDLQCGHLQWWNHVRTIETFQEETTTTEYDLFSTIGQNLHLTSLNCGSKGKGHVDVVVLLLLI